jgi:hypothetical protein
MAYSKAITIICIELVAIGILHEAFIKPQITMLYKQASIRVGEILVAVGIGIVLNI